MKRKRRPVPSGKIVREEPQLTHVAFSRLLEWLDDGVDSHGERYLEMRRRLVSYFDRRNRLSADDLADETLNRIGRTLEKDGAIATTPRARYCYVVAKFVLLEDVRREHLHVPLDERRIARVSAGRGMNLDEPDESLAIEEQRLESLARCLRQLKPEQRELVVDYYRDTGRQKIERRRNLAKRLGITMNALAIRACRIRDALEACVEARCRERRQMDGRSSSCHPSEHRRQNVWFAGSFLGVVDRGAGFADARLARDPHAHSPCGSA
jgi:DNA-directed RNA polymerase specialized sigma24 family protein